MEALAEADAAAVEVAEAAAVLVAGVAATALGTGADAVGCEG